MRIYTAMWRRSPSDDPDLLFVPEGFCWPAFLVPALWLLWYRQWSGLLAYGGLSLAVAGGGYFVDAGPLSGLALALAPNLLAGAFAHDWRRWRLFARGYALVGAIAAPDVGWAEERYVRAHWPARTAAPTPAPAPMAPVREIASRLGANEPYPSVLDPSP